MSAALNGLSENEAARGLWVRGTLAGVRLQLDQLFDSPVAHMAENGLFRGCWVLYSEGPLVARPCLHRSSLKESVGVLPVQWVLWVQHHQGPGPGCCLCWLVACCSQV